MDENQSSSPTPAPASSSGNRNMLYIGIVVLVVVGVLGAVVIFAKPKDNMSPATTESGAVSPSPESVSADTSGEEAMTKGEEVTVNVEASSFKFNPKEIRVKKGDTVKIVLTNKGGTHDFVLDEFNAKTKQLQSGETDTISFVADQAGTFEYYCSVGNHRQMGMVGNLIVE